MSSVRGTAWFRSIMTMLGLGAAFVAFAEASARDPAAEAEIAKIEHIVMKVRTGAELLPYLAPNTVIYDIQPPANYGPKAVADHIDAIMALNTFKNFEANMVTLDIRADDELAFANSVQHLRLTDNTGKLLLETDFRVTNTYEKIGGKWLILFQHLSFPADVKSGKIAYGKVNGARSRGVHGDDQPLTPGALNAQ